MFSTMRKILGFRDLHFYSVPCYPVVINVTLFLLSKNVISLSSYQKIVILFLSGGFYLILFGWS